jgi:hypothetical protein
MCIGRTLIPQRCVISLKLHIDTSLQASLDERMRCLVVVTCLLLMPLAHN